jgi:hypothetical protein
MVNSERIISEKAENVLAISTHFEEGGWTDLKTPYRSALKAPKPAAAEKFPRSMIPLETNTLLISISPKRKRQHVLGVGLVDNG